MRLRSAAILASITILASMSFAAPSVTGLSPDNGPAGTQVQINGSGFGTSQGSSTVTFFNSASASVVSWSDTQIVVTVPNAATTGAVTVTVGGVASNANVCFTVPAPQVTA